MIKEWLLKHKIATSIIYLIYFLVVAAIWKDDCRGGKEYIILVLWELIIPATIITVIWYAVRNKIFRKLLIASICFFTLYIIIAIAYEQIQNEKEEKIKEEWNEKTKHIHVDRTFIFTLGNTWDEVKKHAATIGVRPSMRFSIDKDTLLQAEEMSVEGIRLESGEYCAVFMYFYEDSLAAINAIIMYERTDIRDVVFNNKREEYRNKYQPFSHYCYKGLRLKNDYIKSEGYIEWFSYTDKSTKLVMEKGELGKFTDCSHLSSEEYYTPVINLKLINRSINAKFYEKGRNNIGL